MAFLFKVFLKAMQMKLLKCVIRVFPHTTSFWNGKLHKVDSHQIADPQNIFHQFQWSEWLIIAELQIALLPKAIFLATWNVLASTLCPVVQKLVNTNPGVKVSQAFFFCCWKELIQQPYIWKHPKSKCRAYCNTELKFDVNPSKLNSALNNWALDNVKKQNKTKNTLNFWVLSSPKLNI